MDRLFSLFDVVMITVDDASKKIGKSPSEEALGELKRRCDIIDKVLDKKKCRRTDVDYESDSGDIIIKLSKSETIRYINLWGNKS